MSHVFAKALPAALVLTLAATGLHAQGRYQREQRRQSEPAAPSVAVDKRDSVVGAPGPYSGRAYWLALAECGGIYFKLNTLYTDVAVRARGARFPLLPVQGVPVTFDLAASWIASGASAIAAGAPPPSLKDGVITLDPWTLETARHPISITAGATSMPSWPPASLRYLVALLWPRPREPKCTPIHTVRHRFRK